MTRRPTLAAAAIVAAGLLFAGCTATGASSPTVQTTTTATTGGADATTATTGGTGTSNSADFDLAPWAVLEDNADYTTVNTDEWSEADAVAVELTGTGVAGTVEGVTASGSTVTITQAGVYRLSGTLAGQVRVEAPEDALVVLILDGVAITNTAGAAIEVASADDVAIHLASGSTNSVSDAATYADDATANAAIFAETDLSISGDGALTVKGNGNDGITSKDDLVILGGTITVDATDDALRGKDALVVEGGTLTLNAAAGDGMKSDGDDGEASADIDWTKGYIYVTGGTIAVTAGDDGLQAFTDTIIAGGQVTASVADDGVKAEVIVSIGLAAADADPASAPEVTVAASTEGIEAANVGISAGTVDVTASDDGINASGNAELQALINGTEYVEGDREADTGERLEITGGTVTVKADFDGLDSNGSVTITGGTVTITSAARGGDGPIDANGAVTVADGIVTANGAPWDPTTMGGGARPGGDGGPGGMPPGDGRGPGDQAPPSGAPSQPPR